MRRFARLLAVPMSAVMALGSVTASATTRLPAAPAVDRAAAGQAAGIGLAWTIVGVRRPGSMADAASALGLVAIGHPAMAAFAAATTRIAAFRKPRRITHGRSSHLIVALTFDDGWNAKNGHLVLDILLREHVPATFFVNSVYIAHDPGLWRAIAANGFVVGNHTFAHRDVTKLTQAEIVADLQRNARAWLALTGHPMATLFRPPYGRRNAASDLAAALAGYPDVVMWNRDSRDWSTDRDRRMLENATGGGPGAIVLLHIGPDATPRILERVIASYRERGFTFVTVPQLLGPIRFPVPLLPPAGTRPTRPSEILLGGAT